MAWVQIETADVPIDVLLNCGRGNARYHDGTRYRCTRGYIDGDIIVKDFERWEDD